MCRAHNLFRGAITLLCFLFPTLGAPAGWETSNPKDAKDFETGNLSAVKRILTKGNYIERDLSLLVFALGKATSSGNVDLLRYLNERGWLQKCRQAECYPVHIAAKYGRIDAIRFQITQGFDAKATDYFKINSQYGGNTPLHYAASNGHLETVKFLCDRGVDPSLKNRMAKTALDNARYELDMRHGGNAKEEATAKARYQEIVQYLSHEHCGKE